jgi:hypothetical protein
VWTLVAVGVPAATTACGATNGSGSIIEVPSQAPTVTAALRRARPGDTIVIAPGVYHEAVEVNVADITIRGQDRNTVIFDGQNQLTNGFAVGADGVAIENLTVHSYLQNGVVFSGIDAATHGGAVDPNVAYGTGDAVLKGYRVSYVTAYDDGLYGIYAFSSRDGLIEHSYVSGHPDSGIYVGQCRPCNVVIRDVTAERNAIGYYGTNSSGGVYLIESVFRHNRLGIAPNSEKAENLAPQANNVVAGNVVADNNDPLAPAIPRGFFGGGIAIGGGTSNTVVRNRVTGNVAGGIMIISLDAYVPVNNRIEGNVVSGNGVDLVYAPTGTTGAGGNCFVGNTFATSAPADIEHVMGCAVASSLTTPPTFTTPTPPADSDYQTLPAPAGQPGEPTPAPGTPAGAGSVPTVDVATIAVPAPFRRRDDAVADHSTPAEAPCRGGLVESDHTPTGASSSPVCTVDTQSAFALLASARCATGGTWRPRATFDLASASSSAAVLKSHPHRRQYCAHAVAFSLSCRSRQHRCVGPRADRLQQRHDRCGGDLHHSPTRASSGGYLDRNLRVPVPRQGHRVFADPGDRTQCGSEPVRL